VEVHVRETEVALWKPNHCDALGVWQRGVLQNQATRRIATLVVKNGYLQANMNIVQPRNKTRFAYASQQDGS
jgi:hypothetical protein